MDIKQLKASVQLAQMQVNINPSDDNKTLLDQAQKAYDKEKNSVKSETPKVDQVFTPFLNETQLTYLESLKTGDEQLDIVRKITDIFGKVGKKIAKPVIPPVGMEKPELKAKVIVPAVLAPAPPIESDSNETDGSCEDEPNDEQEGSSLPVPPAAPVSEEKKTE